MLPPSQKINKKTRKRNEEKKAIRNAQTVPDRPTVVPSVPLVYRVVLFVSNLHADFLLSHAPFLFSPVGQSFLVSTSGPLGTSLHTWCCEIPTLTTRLACFMCTRSSGSPGRSVDLAQHDEESLERSPVITWDSITKFLNHHGRPIHASFNLSSHRGRRASLRKRQVEANRRIQR